MPGNVSDALLERMGDARLLLIFDGTCGVCTRFTDWIERHDASGRVRQLPNQAAGLLELTGLTRAEVDREAWAFDRAGRSWGGAAAINRALRELGGPWRLLSLAYALPLVGWCEDAGYRLFARHRGRLSRWGVTPACERPGAGCTSDV